MCEPHPYPCVLRMRVCLRPYPCVFARARSCAPVSLSSLSLSLSLSLALAGMCNHTQGGKEARRQGGKEARRHAVPHSSSKEASRQVAPNPAAGYHAPLGGMCWHSPAACTGKHRRAAEASGTHTIYRCVPGKQTFPARGAHARQRFVMLPANSPLPAPRWSTAAPARTARAHRHSPHACAQMEHKWRGKHGI